MTKCERLQALHDEAVADGNEVLARALQNAMDAAGCGVTAQDEGGGNGNGPPQDPGPVGP